MKLITKHNTFRPPTVVGVAILLTAVAARGTLLNYQNAVTNETSLISYYTFDKTNANDGFGTNNGTLRGTAQIAPGIGGGQGLFLDGRGYVQLGKVSDFSFPSGRGTVEAWIQVGWSLENLQPVISDNPCLFANRDLDSLTWSVHMNNVLNGVGVWNGASYEPQAIPDPLAVGVTGTNWHHLAVVWDNASGSATTTLFWDGIQVGQTGQALGNSPAPTQLGSSGSEAVNEGWIGMLDEVALYGSALSSNAIQAHYQAFLQDMPPVIARQPSGGTFLAGTAIRLSVQAVGLHLTYQWYVGATAIPSATNSTFLIPGLTVTNTGDYRVVVSCSSPLTNVTSSAATIGVASSVPPTLASYQATVRATPGLISYYTFDGFNADDTFSTNSGFLVGNARFAAGVGGGPGLGLCLDGRSWVELGSVPDFEFGSGTGTAEAWVQGNWPRTVSPQDIFLEDLCVFSARDNQSVVWSVRLGRNRQYLALANGSSYPEASILDAGTNWHHLAVVWDNSAGTPMTTFFWDGVAIGQTDQGLGTGAAPTHIGSDATSGVYSDWIGMVDEVAFYRVALSTNSIQQHYNAFFGDTLPVILTQPVGGGFLSGRALLLNVEAAGAGLTYQWFKDNSPVAGATNASMSIANLTTSDAGGYYVMVTARGGSSNSAKVMVTVAQQVANYQASVLAEPSLISYYTFDSGDARDSKGTNHGMPVGIVEYGAGVGQGIDKCLILNGTNSINLGHVPAFDFTNGTGTLEAWIRMDWASSPPGYLPCLFANRNDSGINWSIIALPDQTQIGDWDANGYWPIPLPGQVTGWHHFATTFGMAAGMPLASFYWDGSQIGMWSQAVGATNGLTTQLGSDLDSSTADGWIGAMDEVAFYGAQLEPGAIMRHYSAMTVPPPAPLITWSRSGSQLTLFWPAEATKFTLESTTNLSASAWTAVAGVISNQFIVDMSRQTAFYRLRR